MVAVEATAAATGMKLSEHIVAKAAFIKKDLEIVRLKNNVKESEEQKRKLEEKLQQLEERAVAAEAAADAVGLELMERVEL